MYSVSITSYKKHNCIIKIHKSPNGKFVLPSQAMFSAFSLQRRLKSNGLNVKFLINQKVLVRRQVESWAEQEYKALPKCDECGKFIEDGYNKFCSETCSIHNYEEQLEKIKDEREIDYL